MVSNRVAIPDAESNFYKSYRTFVRRFTFPETLREIDLIESDRPALLETAQLPKTSLVRRFSLLTDESS